MSVEHLSGQIRVGASSLWSVWNCLVKSKSNPVGLVVNLVYKWTGSEENRLGSNLVQIQAKLQLLLAAHDLCYCRGWKHGRSQCRLRMVTECWSEGFLATSDRVVEKQWVWRGANLARFVSNVSDDAKAMSRWEARRTMELVQI